MSIQFIINGRFMEDRMHGLVRYAREMTAALDKLLDDSMSVTILIPPTAKNVPHYKRIVVEKNGNYGGIRWEQTSLRKYVKTHKNAICINFCNVTPFGVQPGITAILDIMYKVNPSHYRSIRNRVSRYWHMLQYSYVTKHEKAIITISDFCKEEIEKHYSASKGKITVIPCAWQHVLNYIESPDWQNRYPYLKSGEFYFSLATLSKNKNGKWIIDVAKKNPKSVFAIGGKHYETEYDSIPDNVHMLGYISDEDACSLMKNCRAFIFPSLYEGFGLPPLEALALGADVIASQTTSLPEVLGNSVHYIDPHNTNINIDKLLSDKVMDRNEALEKFSWEKSADKLLKLMKKQ